MYICPIQQVEQKEDELCGDLSCTKNQLRQVVNIFQRSISQILRQLGCEQGENLIDTTHQHFWSLPAGEISTQSWDALHGKTCMCGAITNTGELSFTFLQEPIASSSNHSNGDDPDITGAVDISNANLLDSFPSYVNAFQNAIVTANLLLGIQHYIHDTN